MPTAPKIQYDAEAAVDEFTPDALSDGEAADAMPDDNFSQDEETAPVVRLLAPVSSFVYAVGHVVQPVPGGRAREVIWRGQLKERRPETGLVHRVNVYRLNDGFWDCYREDELQVA